MKPAANCVRSGACRVLLAAVACALGAQTGGAAQFELHRAIPELRLKNGAVLHEVTFVSVGATSITGRWDGGRGAIALALLPDEVCADLAPAAPAKPVPAAASVPTPTPAPPGTADDAAPNALAVPLPSEIALTNGFIMHQAKVVSWQADAMTVTYVGGKVLVRFDNVAPAQRPLFVAHKDAVFARQARIAEARAGKNLPAAPASQEAKAAQIKAGIAAHQLVIGMTQDQVRMAYGYPDQTAADPGVPAYEYWIYLGRGLTPSGAACNRFVGFDRGIMDGWKDN
jgi:hypothetical protein